MYDYIVIGAGSGGIASGRRAAGLYGKKVAIVENRVIGGTCVNVGCVPKKVMFNLSSFIEDTKVIEGYGLKTQLDLDFNHFKQRRDAYVKRLNGIYENMLKNNNVDYYQGTASFVDAKTVEVEANEKQQLEGKHILIASGSSCENKEQFEGHELCMNSDDIFEMTSVPKDMIVIGGGYIGLEMAQIMNGFGSNVTMVCRSYPLKFIDDEIREQLYINLKKLNINCMLNAKHKRVTKLEDGRLQLELENGDKLEAECILVAIGREPNLKRLKLENAGVELTQKGYVKVDEYQNTNIDGVYAIGDVTDCPQLTPVAIKAGRILTERLFNNKNIKMNYNNIPTVIFSHPPIGVIGMNQQEAEQKYGQNNVAVYKSSFNNMFYSLSNHDEHKLTSLFKLICRKDGDDEIVIGVHAIGRGIDEILQGVSIAVTKGLTKQDFDDTVAIHPSAAEEFVLMNPKFI